MPDVTSSSPLTPRLPTALGGWVGNLGFTHRRVMGVPRPRYSYPVRDSELPDCFTSVSIPSHVGIPTKVRYGIPILSDYPKMGADIPPLSVYVTLVFDINVRIVGFTPGLKGGILSLNKIESVLTEVVDSLEGLL